jgi:hypothetical protein
MTKVKNHIFCDYASTCVRWGSGGFMKALALGIALSFVSGCTSVGDDSGVTLEALIAAGTDDVPAEDRCISVAPDEACHAVGRACEDTVLSREELLGCVRMASQEAEASGLLTSDQHRALLELADRVVLNDPEPQEHTNGSSDSPYCAQNTADPQNVLYNCSAYASETQCNGNAACRWVVPKTKKSLWERIFGSN